MKIVRAKSILNASGGCNPYRGCTHGCIYCDSRSVCYRIWDFTDVEVKENAPELLDTELAKKRKKFVVTTGSMCDPYLPLERETLLTRRMLETICRRGFGAGVLTKSDLALRDLELFRRIHRCYRAVVCYTITAIDDDLCRLIEPNVCPTSARLAALSAFAEAGIDTGVWMTPVLPYLTDTEENVAGIVRACGKAGVKYIVTFGFGTTMRAGSREYFYSQLDARFPGLKERYVARYGDRYECPSPRADALEKVFFKACEEQGIRCREEDIRRFLQERDGGEQLSLPL